MVDSEGKNLELIETNSERLGKRCKKSAMDQKDILTYPINKGKTGLTADINCTLVINYYGSGAVDRKRLHEDYKKYESDQNSLVRYLFEDNKSSIPIGLLKLHCKDDVDGDMKGTIGFSENTIERLDSFLKDHDSSFVKVMNPAKEDYSETGDQYAHSFLALPINDRC